MVRLLIQLRSLWGHMMHVLFIAGTSPIISLMVATVIARLTPLDPGSQHQMLGMEQNGTVTAQNLSYYHVFFCGPDSANVKLDSTVSLKVAVSLSLLVGIIQVGVCA